MASSSSAPQNRASVSPELPPQLPPVPMFKNNLIQFALKSNMKHPEFFSRNEGSIQAPAYRSSVMVDGLVFTSQLTFFHRKAAEQEVARFALEYLTKKVKDEAYSIMSEAVTFCKTVLNEYASKLSIQLPTYKSVEYKEVIPYFVCTLDLNGTSYTGDAARRKKDAVELAARAAILSILGNSNSGVLLAQIIKTKAKLFDSTKPKALQPTCDSVLVLPEESSERSSLLLQLFGAKDKDVADPLLDDKEKDKGVADPLFGAKGKVVTDPMGNDNINEIEMACPESGPIISTSQQPEMQTHEPTPEAAKSSNEPEQPSVALPIDTGVSVKRRRRLKYKANKKARMEAELKALNGSSCVAQ
ncbi:double-stranded RNA-binding motif protein [Medicago truncatula]|uniref:Double-stranded RNA-binding motif protein n=1 Tax=Medicago truncatula TaxID=3880 RepID=G7K1Y4_MEDTR|nr:double-stranded RNA-binding motif protein [Medicago truncatula]